MISTIFLRELMSLFYEEQTTICGSKAANVYPQNFDFLKTIYRLSRIKCVNSYVVRYFFFTCKNKKRNLCNLFFNKKKILTVKGPNNKNLISFNTYTKARIKLQSSIVVILHKRCFFNMAILLGNSPLKYQPLPSFNCLYSLRIYLILSFNNQENPFSIFCYLHYILRDIICMEGKYLYHRLTKLFMNKVKKNINFYSNCLLNTFMHKDNHRYNKISLCFFTKANKHWQIFLKT